MSDFVVIGPTPSDEECAQVGDDNYFVQSQLECRRFIELLRKTFGPEPVGSYLTTKAFPHDYGRYYEVVCYFNEDVPVSIDYAFRCEREAPTTWATDEVGMTSPSCPECGSMLEPGSALAYCSQLISDGYLCKSCKLIFAHDLTVLANYVG